ncbi:MAG: basic amino acid ABC transporter substrate-binding protein [candidate division Zixibacteria bacterium]|nr:basic amino acid ABC transporter substrate-binding protein [candidate division Zixibacteria bacterium]
MKITKLRFITLLFYTASVLILAVCSKQEFKDSWEKVQTEGILRVGTDATYPPFETQNPETGDLEGFDIELMTAICEEIGVTPEFIVIPFDGSISGLLKHKYEALISAMTITPQRAEKVAFSNPYYWASQSIAVRIDEKEIRSKENLPGKRIGVQLGTTGEMVAKRIPDAEVISFDNIGAAFIDLENGNVDAVINDLPTSTRVIKTKGGAKIIGKPLTSERYGIAVRPEDKRLLLKINNALAIIEVSGKLQEIKDKWL